MSGADEKEDVVVLDVDQQQSEVETTTVEDEHAAARREYEALKAEKDALAKRAAQIEAERQQFAEQNARLAQSEAQAHHLAATNAIAATNAELDNASRVYVQAMSSGDYATAAEAQRYINNVQHNLRGLEQTKQQIESYAQQQTHQPRQQTDRFEEVIRSMPPRTGEWLRRHPEVVNDQRKQRTAQSLHNLAIDQYGLSPESDEYFRFIDDNMGYSASTQQQPKQTSFVPAVPARNSGSGKGAEDIHLTREQMDYARSLGMSNREYSDSIKAIKEGRAGNLRFG